MTTCQNCMRAIVPHRTRTVPILSVLVLSHAVGLRPIGDPGRPTPTLGTPTPNSPNPPRPPPPPSAGLHPGVSALFTESAQNAFQLFTFGRIGEPESAEATTQNPAPHCNTGFTRPQHRNRRVSTQPHFDPARGLARVAARVTGPSSCSDPGQLPGCRARPGPSWGVDGLCLQDRFTSQWL
jgi:hypothetical protein